MKKVYYNVIVFLLPVLCLVSIMGCGQTSQSSSSVVVSPSTKKITIWHFMTDREEVLNELVRKYETENDVSISLELCAPTEIYNQKVRAAAQTKMLPDVFSIVGEKRELASFIIAGFVENLSPYLEANDAVWKKTLFASALKMDYLPEENPYGIAEGYYGIPLDMMNIQFIYNKKLFEKAGLDSENPPRTWDEFIAAGKKLKAAGIQGLVSGFSEIWMLDCLASNFAYNIMGEEKIVATIRGEVPYTDPDWVRVFQLFDDMRQADMYASGIVSMLNKRAELIFSAERAAITFNGSWCVNVFHEMNPSLDYVPMFIPKVSDNYPLTIWGGAGVHFMVNAQSEVKDESVAFLKWLTEEPQQIVLAEKTRNIPANRNAVQKIPELLRAFADDMDNINHPRFLPVNESPNVIELFDKGIQSIIIGEKSPEEVAADVQLAKERALKKALSINR